MQNPRKPQLALWQWFLIGFGATLIIPLAGYGLWNLISPNSSPVFSISSIFNRSTEDKKDLFIIAQDGKLGKFVISPRFDGVANFSEGLAAVNIGNKVGYINKIGEIVISLQFDGELHPPDHPAFIHFASFSEGLAVVVVNGKGDYIDKTGKFAIVPQYDSATPFSGGLAHVSIGEKGHYTILLG
ncbi:MAG: WG repeat-containing protein [Iphinoe sp. HA4291-MV1]|jgi:hypothetical protein|nr:WG repeat-containing protein [Iphinoe sp. HA4291-MV1]